MYSWTLVPHFYQPPTQSLILTEQIVRSCYLPFIDLLIENPQVEMSFNLSASLILQLERIQNHDFFQKMKILINRNQIEFLNSPIFHPILPLTPPDVISRQIKESTTVIERFTGVLPVPGFFPPELAINEAVLKLLSGNGFNFAVVDESSVNPNFDLNKIPANSVYKLDQFDKLDKFILLISSRSLTELLRSYPTELKAENLIKFIESQSSSSPNSLINQSTNQLVPPLVCATDVEVFGHHYSERLQLLKDLFQSNKFRFIKATTAISNFKFQISNLSTNNVIASSWQTSREDLRQKVPFAMWHNPNNKLQTKYAQLAKLAYSALSQVESETTIENISHPVHSAQNHFDQGISSCHSYWLSNAPWWHPDMVELGARNLIKCIRTLPLDQKYKTEAENFYHKFMLEVWQFHWSGKVEENYLKFENQREDLLKSLPKI